LPRRILSALTGELIAVLQRVHIVFSKKANQAFNHQLDLYAMNGGAVLGLVMKVVVQIGGLPSMLNHMGRLYKSSESDQAVKS
jgi:hypothetical protein